MVEAGMNEVMEEIRVRDIILHLQECHAFNLDWEGERGSIPASSPQGYHDRHNTSGSSSTAQPRESDVGGVLLPLLEEEETLRRKKYLQEIAGKFHNKFNGYPGVSKTIHYVEAYMLDHPLNIRPR